MTVTSLDEFWWSYIIGLEYRIGGVKSSVFMFKEDDRKTISDCGEIKVQLNYYLKGVW